MSNWRVQWKLSVAEVHWGVFESERQNSNYLNNPTPAPCMLSNRQNALCPLACLENTLEGNRVTAPGEGFGKCIARVRVHPPLPPPSAACLVEKGTGGRHVCIYRRGVRGMIVCPGDVPTVDSHWFANREPQAPGAMSKYERLPRSVRLGNERE